VGVGDISLHLQTLKWRFPARPIEKLSVRRDRLSDIVAAAENKNETLENMPEQRFKYYTFQFDSNHGVNILHALPKYLSSQVDDRRQNISYIDINSIEAFFPATTVPLRHEKRHSRVTYIWIQSLNFAMLSFFLMNRERIGKSCLIARTTAIIGLLMDGHFSSWNAKTISAKN